MLENRLKIFIKKQLCSTNVQPPFSKNKFFGNHIHHVMTKDSNQKSITKYSL